MVGNSPFDVLNYFITLWHLVLFLNSVIVISATGDSVRKIMISAHNLGMVGGNYVFISYHPINNTKSFGADSWYQVNNSHSPFRNHGFGFGFGFRFRALVWNPERICKAQLSKLPQGQASPSRVWCRSRGFEKGHSSLSSWLISVSSLCFLITLV